MALPDWLQQLLAILGGVGAVLLAVVAVAYWLFQTFAKGWLDARFNERLERLRHSQAIELENLRLEINKTFDRSTKLLNKELEVLPACWSSLDEAHMLTQRVCSSFRQSIDVSRMSDEQLSTLLDTMGLVDWQKREIMEAEDRGEVYSKYETLLWLHRAKVAYSEFHNFIVRSGVFVRPEISAKLDEAAKEIADALRLRKLISEPNMNLPSLRADIDRALSRSDELHQQIRRDVQGLWFADRSSVDSKQAVSR